MGRYLGPVCKLCRREGEKLFLKGSRCESPKCSVVKRAFPPGKSAAVRKKQSEYGIRLREKQKAKRFYGLSEKQFKNMYDRAVLKKGIKGENFLRSLELRFDNVITRLGLASSHNQARTLIRHGHFMINNVKVDIPSYELKEKFVISINEKSKPQFLGALESISKKKLANWLAFDISKQEGIITKEPVRVEMDVPVNERLIVEYYSR
ncbi:MAG: 30S ribosomal protein S4 [Candidatus Margulisiibacteriota bacterium]|nr:MAG: 30S ribosomal protein S4 [Candidatus Margulisbacteria bacterium GWD2_39_127]OGI04621.1 MAG: 30S ribosomal protein S4 [Candidatus Margulisbacteria bacterium GWF2_38_17]OGI11847.1 MAG: 30S ribosomal protein S4 [Candidatus Margulisbacteria bacterium GWE2_39_32]PZM79778.1 MAG: 30S ribosomal protein S4 [Candidatus Margulisiibacteriota bacterium]HAR62683.1 30S ribosomal protein S4 [Candidatus Margulisiibacteriota bacterium]